MAAAQTSKYHGKARLQCPCNYASGSLTFTATALRGKAMRFRHSSCTHMGLATRMMNP
jgi:hypothetical protein